MAINIRNAKVERLADELADMTGESRTAAILHALEERRERIVRVPARKPRLAHVLDFLEKEIWPNIPKNRLGRRLTKNERERILGYGKRGV
jgi:antitoxin VapB